MRCFTLKLGKKGAPSVRKGLARLFVELRVPVDFANSANAKFTNAGDCGVCVRSFHLILNQLMHFACDPLIDYGFYWVGTTMSNRDFNSSEYVLKQFQFELGQARLIEVDFVEYGVKFPRRFAQFRVGLDVNLCVLSHGSKLL